MEEVVFAYLDRRYGSESFFSKQRAELAERAAGGIVRRIEGEREGEGEGGGEGGEGRMTYHLKLRDLGRPPVARPRSTFVTKREREKYEGSNGGGD